MTTAATATMLMAAVLPNLLLTWRCHGCRHIVARLQYDGQTVIEVKHHCNTWNRLPDDAHHLREEARR